MNFFNGNYYFPKGIYLSLLKTILQQQYLTTATKVHRGYLNEAINRLRLWRFFAFIFSVEVD